jgi:transposase
MSLRKQSIGPVPEDTARIAKAAFRKRKNKYVVFADAFDTVFSHDDFSELFPVTGRSAIHPARLALLILVQYAEGLSDRDTMEALDSRIDLKYLLHLPMDHEGYDHTALTHFRERMVSGSAESLLFDKILDLAKENNMLSKDKQRSDSTHVLSAARSMGRLELVLETMRVALDWLCDEAPEFLLRVSNAFEMNRAYEARGLEFPLPKKEADKKALSEAIARDAKRLLNSIDLDSTKHHLKKNRPIVNLRRIIAEQFDDDDKGEPIQKEDADLAPSANRLASPHDRDARNSSKRGVGYFGYKVHFTETCVDGFPRLITDVQTTKATKQDAPLLHVIQRSLISRQLAPQQHLVDRGYTNTAAVLKSSKLYGIETIGPFTRNDSWQKIDNKGFAASDFEINWRERKVTCPAGINSNTWRERPSRGCIEVVFPSKNCQSCPFKETCTKSTTGGRRLEFKPQPVFEFLQARRQHEDSAEFKDAYRPRAGIEATFSRAVRKCTLRRSRYFGEVKTHLHNLFAAAATNFLRIMDKLMDLGTAKTRNSKFRRLRTCVA